MAPLMLQKESVTDYVKRVVGGDAPLRRYYDFKYREPLQPQADKDQEAKVSEKSKDIVDGYLDKKHAAEALKLGELSLSAESSSMSLGVDTPNEDLRPPNKSWEADAVAAGSGYKNFEQHMASALNATTGKKLETVVKTARQIADAAGDVDVDEEEMRVCVPVAMDRVLLDAYQHAGLPYQPDSSAVSVAATAVANLTRNHGKNTLMAVQRGVADLGRVEEACVAYNRATQEKAQRGVQDALRGLAAVEAQHQARTGNPLPAAQVAALAAMKEQLRHEAGSGQ